VQGIEGVVVEETLGSLLLETRDGEKRVLKKGNSFLFTKNGVVVDGKEFYCRPEQRTKKLFKKLR
jgi:RNase P/RNase MRP subunit p29